MAFFLQLLITGLCLGSIYALIALGFVVIYKCSHVFNIAQGAIVLLGGYLGWWLLAEFNLPVWLCLLMVIVIAAVVGILIERLALRPMIGQPILAVIMMTIALANLIQGIVCMAWGGVYQTYPPVFGSGSIGFAGISISTESIAGLILSVASVAILVMVFRFTKQGLAMRATAEDEQVVQSSGIRVTTVHRLSWVIACIVGGLGGILLGSISGVSLPLSEIGLKSLAIVLLGGLDSIPGTIVAGLIVGVLENVTAGYLDPLLPTGGGLASVFPYIVMIIVLIFKPYGLYGLTRIERI